MARFDAGGLNYTESRIFCSEHAVRHVFHRATIHINTGIDVDRLENNGDTRRCPYGLSNRYVGSRVPCK